MVHTLLGLLAGVTDTFAALLENDRSRHLLTSLLSSIQCYCGVSARASSGNGAAAFPAAAAADAGTLVLLQ
jgi:hypothetical protein